jgi:hypothetical protein
MGTESRILDLTGKPHLPTSDLFVEIEAVKVYNQGGKFSSDQVVFNCPYCHKRNRQNIRRAIASVDPKTAAFKCQCRRLVYVRKPAPPQSLILSPYTR